MRGEVIKIVGQRMPEKANDFVIKGTWIINIILLVCHVNFAFLFYFNNADVLFWFNCGSVAVYLISFELLRREMAWTYVYLVFAEIYLFMIISVMFLGWEFGFQHYCISFIASLFFSDFYMNGVKTISKKPVVMGMFNAFLYIILRVWTHYHPYIYKIENKLIVNFMYVMNTLIGFSFLIMYLSIYSHTVNKLERELRQMAERDPLTGLYNRRKMMQLLSLAVDSEKNEKIAVAMLDADFFKKINDTYGHDAGDEVLKRLADILKNKDSGDGKFFICRWGGEEFFVLYKYEGTRESVIDEFEALRSTVEDSGVTYEDQKIRITVTIGLAFYHSGIQLNDLLKEADTLLYDGKESGRNCVSTNIAKLQTI